MASIFTKIVQGEIPAYKVAENDKFLAFLDAFPIAKGHTLVIPKKEVDRIWDLDKETYTELMAFAYDVAAGIEKAIPCNRVGVTVMGLEIPHAHVHLVPMSNLNDMDFTKEKPSFTKEEMEKIRKSISDKIENK